MAIDTLLDAVGAEGDDDLPCRCGHGIARYLRDGCRPARAKPEDGPVPCRGDGRGGRGAILADEVAHPLLDGLHSRRNLRQLRLDVTGLPGGERHRQDDADNCDYDHRLDQGNIPLCLFHGMASLLGVSVGYIRIHFTMERMLTGWLEAWAHYREEFGVDCRILISPQSTLLLAALCGGICLPALASPQHHADVEFKKNGRIVKTVPVQDLSMSVAAISVSVFEVHEKKNRTYTAHPVRELFNKVFGAGWESSGEILFTSTDGYRASIPVSKFVAYDAYLAVAQDGLPFTMVNTLQNNELVELGPLYLVWDNIKSRVLRDEGASDVPYQVRSIELTTSMKHISNASPPDNASAEVRRGFGHFRKHCMACHAVNGDGGHKAPELNYPTSVVEYIKPGYLARWIDNPAGIRHGTLMPSLSHGIPDREMVARQIIAYLVAMSATKRDPGR